MTISLRFAVAVVVGGTCIAGFGASSSPSAKPALRSAEASGRRGASPVWRLSAKITLPGKNVILESVVAVSAKSAWTAGFAHQRKSHKNEAIIERWSGGEWHLVKVPGKVLASFDRGPRGYAGPPSVIIGASSDRNVWVFSQLSGTWLHWNGHQWRDGRLPAQSRSAETAITAEVVIAEDSVWALGASVGSNGGTRSYAARFNGRRWDVTAMPAGLDLPVSAVSAVGRGDIWATIGYAGQLFFPPQGNGGAIVRWNGRRWQRRDLPAGIGSHGDPVSVLALSDHDVWVGGGRPGKTGDLTETAEHWSGSGWQATEPPAAPGKADCVFRSAAATRSGIVGLAECFSDSNPGQVRSRLWMLSAGRWTGPIRPHLAGGNPAFLDLARKGRSGPVWVVGYVGGAGVISSCAPVHC